METLVFSETLASTTILQGIRTQKDITMSFETSLRAVGREDMV
jgi:hypothetical protein